MRTIIHITGEEIRALSEGEKVKKWLPIHRQIEKKLQILDAATSLEDLKHLPGNRFEALKGDRKGQYSIRINQQWRVCFRWEEGEAP